MESTLYAAGDLHGGDTSNVLADAIQQVFEHATTTTSLLERRATVRLPYGQLFGLVPVESPDSLTPTHEEIFVVGKNISSRGLGFFHQAPIPSRFAVVSLPLEENKFCRCLVKILWCRFLQPGWYDSGGEIISVIDDVAAKQNAAPASAQDAHE